MYLDHFGLSRLPFTIAPDPEFLFPSQGHQEALAHLQYALSGHGGLICLTGEVGTGKTILCRAFLASTPDDIKTAYLFNPHLSATELLQSIADELGISYQATDSQKILYARINTALLEWYAQGKRVICLIDEAQAMPMPLLEQVRLLTNLETDQEKLLTLILVGQPELRDILARHELRQFNQRITARYHLHHLSALETAAYLKHRLAQANCHEPLFDRTTSEQIWRATGGVPRLINSVADRALLGTYATGQSRVQSDVVKQAVTEVLGRPVPSIEGVNQNRLRRVGPAATTVLLALVLVSGLMWSLNPAVQQWLTSPETSSLSGTDAKASERPAPPLEQDLDSDSDSLGNEGDTPSSPSPTDNPAIAAIAQTLGLAGNTCAEIRLSGWQCLSVSWPDSQLRPLAQRVAVRDLSGQWRVLADLEGRYRRPAQVVWQPPAGYSGLVRPNQVSAVVPWVRQALGVDWHGQWQVIGPASGTQTRLLETRYDPILANEVAVFQVRNGLTADQIIGPQTLMYLQLRPEDD